MIKKLKKLVKYFTVRDVVIDMYDTSPETQAEFKRLENVFILRPFSAFILMIVTWVSLVLVPVLPYRSTISSELLRDIGLSLFLICFITAVLMIMENRREKTHLRY